MTAEGEQQEAVCGMRFCGHPESSHFCEDEGGPEPYHGDDWCGDCAWPGTAHEFKPPTPTPSLEEARRQYFETAPVEHYGDVTMHDPYEAFRAGWAAARAEVIREVEAAIEARLAAAPFDHLRREQVMEVLRARSQGGEGKA